MAHTHRDTAEAAGTADSAETTDTAADTAGTAEAAADPTDDRTLTRWGRVWQAFFAAAVAAPTLVAVIGAPGPAEAATTVLLAAGLGLWHWAAAVRWEELRGWPHMLVWLAGVLVFTGLLLDRHDSYLFLIYGLYPQIFALMGRRAVPGIVVVTLVVFWRTGALGADIVAADVLSIAGSVGLALLVGLFLNAVVEQSTKRKEALQALEATRAQLAATARRAGVLEERERLAREIHDTVAQGFAGIVTHLEASEQALEDNLGKASEHIDRARRSARDSLAELRRAVQALRPSDLEGANLAEALDRATRRWSDETGIAGEAAVAGTVVALHPEAEVALLRTAQEALANVAKHAGATRASLRLEYRGDAVTLRVDDDGRGFDPSDPGAGSGLGLRGMAERVSALGGSLRVDSAHGQGTSLLVEVPLR